MGGAQLVARSGWAVVVSDGRRAASDGACGLRQEAFDARMRRFWAHLRPDSLERHVVRRAPHDAIDGGEQLLELRMRGDGGGRGGGGPSTDDQLRV